MMGAGLIKFRSGDKKWKDLTAMNYFYETQPVPNPLTRYMHWMSPAWHKIEVLFNHFVEVVAPWFFILPGVPVAVRRTGGIIQLAFQSVLIASGNLSFLNWLTMVPAIMCLDDAFLGRFFSPLTQSAARSAASSSWLCVSITREAVNLAFLALVLTLSRPVVKNLLSKQQAMNRSYDPLRLINTYGAFGTVNEEREEFIISSAIDRDGPWKEYEFKVKPGDVNRSPQFISPYHYRLDWQMWIAATGRTIDRSPWMYRFLVKLLQQDDAVLNGLMAGDPWNDSPVPPKYARIDRYRYKFHKPVKGEKNPPYWDRELIGKVYPRQGVATIESLEQEIGRR
jgi:lipase maturation factor 1